MLATCRKISRASLSIGRFMRTIDNKGHIPASSSIPLDPTTSLRAYVTCLRESSRPLSVVKMTIVRLGCKIINLFDQLTKFYRCIEPSLYLPRTPVRVHGCEPQVYGAEPRKYIHRIFFVRTHKLNWVPVGRVHISRYVFSAFLCMNVGPSNAWLISLHASSLGGLAPVHIDHRSHAYGLWLDPKIIDCHFPLRRWHSSFINRAVVFPFSSSQYPTPPAGGPSGLPMVARIFPCKGSTRGVHAAWSRHC